MSNTQEQLPHWDLTAVYPSLESAEFEAGFKATLQHIADLVALFDQHQIDRVDDPATLPLNLAATTDTILLAFNQALDQLYTLSAYITAYISTNSRNNLALARYSELQQHLSQVSILGTRLTAWLGSLDVEQLIGQTAVAQDHAFMLRRAKTEAQHLMSPAEETLAAELNLTGSSSWFQMFSNYTSQLTVAVEIEGESKKLPLTAAQNLLYNPSRALRQAVFASTEETLSQVTVPMAAALNSVKGETLTLSRRRGWQSPLEMVLFDNLIDQATLEAMLDATRTIFPDLRRYLKARAKVLGLPLLAYYDRLVPLGEATTPWSYAQARQFILDQFATYSPKMAQMAQRAFAESWIDAEPHDGKRGGAFCMWLQQGESRILDNFEPNFTSVSTLAHELGHAYHNLNLAQRTPLQRNMPMTLAETASTFCQKVVENAALQTAVAQDTLIILDGLLEYATRVLLGSTADFDFEQALFAQRRKRELGIDEIRELSYGALTAVFAEAIDPETITRHRWVYVPHYYLTSYYNFPYTFGLLFGLGLYAQYQADPSGFRTGYDELLSATGMSEAAPLAARFGIDLRQPDFWQASLDVLRAEVARFVALAES